MKNEEIEDANSERTEQEIDIDAMTREAMRQHELLKEKLAEIGEASNVEVDDLEVH